MTSINCALKTGSDVFSLSKISLPWKCTVLSLIIEIKQFKAEGVSMLNLNKALWLWWILLYHLDEIENITGVVSVVVMSPLFQGPRLSERHECIKVTFSHFHHLYSDKSIQRFHYKLPKLLCTCSTLQLPSWRGQRHQQGIEKRSEEVSCLFSAVCPQLPDSLWYLPLYCSPGRVQCIDKHWHVHRTIHKARSEVTLNELHIIKLL